MMAQRFEWTATLLWLVLLALGGLLVTSASLEIASVRYGGALTFAARHGLYLVVSLATFLAVLMVPVVHWRRLGPLAYLGSVVLLLAVLVVGREVNGSLRWIGFGPLTLQPSELAKFGLLIYLAHSLTRHQEAVRSSLWGMVRPLVWLLGPMALILAEPDLGSVVVIMVAAGGLVTLAGARLRDLTLVVVLGGALVGAAVYFQPYRLARFQTFLNPWADEFGTGYQLTQALIAFGRGEWFGVGLGEGLQKLFYLPEAHTDFIYAVLAEELGALGALMVLAMLVVLVQRGLAQGRRAELRGDFFAAFLAYGAGFLLAVQVLVSLGVNTGVLPTKGLTLPFLSYGGNSLVVSSALVALIARVAWENDQAPPSPTSARGERKA